MPRLSDVSKVVFPVEVLALPLKSPAAHATSLLQTWGLSGIPFVLIYIHNPPRHLSHPALRHGAKA